MHEVSITDLSFTYENRVDHALEHVNLTVDSKDFILLAGASGSGKSTLIKCINGLIPHRYLGTYSGEVKVREKAVTESRFLDMSLLVGTVLQEADKQLVSSIVDDDIAFGPCNMALPRSEIQHTVEHHLASMDILQLRMRSIFAISGGQKQRLAIADVLAMQPSIVLFDEPLANLDSNGVRLMQTIFRELHESGKTIIVAEHRTEEVLRANPTRVVVIESGRIVEDSRDPEVLMKFGDNLKVPAGYIVKHQKNTGARKVFPQTNLFSPALGAELIRVENVSFEYPGGIKALSNVNLSIREGERIALLGNNGAGKSTLVLSMIGILKPTTGQVAILGQNTKKLSTSEIARSICLVFQNPFSMLFAKTVQEELSFGPKNVGVSVKDLTKIVPETAKWCSIEHLLDKSPYASSFGEKKRICVGAVLAMRPKCIILDEPTAGQDYKRYSNFMDFICSLNERVKSFIVITHDPDLAIEYTDRAIVLNNGCVIADGPTRRLLADPSILSRGAIRETSLIELSRQVTGGKSVMRLAELTQMSSLG